MRKSLCLASILAGILIAPVPAWSGPHGSGTSGASGHMENHRQNTGTNHPDHQLNMDHRMNKDQRDERREDKEAERNENRHGDQRNGNGGMGGMGMGDRD